MADDLVFYTNPMSRGRIVRWMLEETGVPYRTEVIAYGPPMKSAEYRAVNPMGKVPALKHGETVVTECAAICAYVADAFPQAGLAPAPSEPERGTYLRWLFFAAGPVDTAVTLNALGYAPPEDRRGMVGYGDYDTVVSVLEQAVSEGPYLCGERFTAADVYLGSQIGWGINFKTLPERPAFRRYFERISAREAYARARALDDALMPPAAG